MLLKIVSGGQTGVDRGALDAALERGFACGGWCPCGRRAEDGRIPMRYPLRKLDSGKYLDRTHRNVADADGTLIQSRGTLTGGTNATAQFARKIGKPLLAIDFHGAEADTTVAKSVNGLRRAGAKY
jgi:predicted Rossmann fold nucleotide-binding protein DprA/Smf involved in DNA uptake